MAQNRLAHVFTHLQDQPQSKPSGGWIYFFGCDGFVKVGYAQDVAGRLSNAQTCNPHPVTLLAMFPAANMLETEAELHSLLRPYHHRAEWFRLPDPILALVIVLGAEYSGAIGPVCCARVF